MIRQLDSAGTLRLSSLEANILIQQSLNLPSVLSWNLAGESLALALRTRRWSTHMGFADATGIATIDLRWGWRIENPDGAQYFGFSDAQCIAQALDTLLGIAITHVAVTTPFSELLIEFANGSRLIGLGTPWQSPAWQIRLPKQLRICCVAGGLFSIERDAIGPPAEQRIAHTEGSTWP
jgi:hypothetical protein